MNRADRELIAEAMQDPRVVAIVRAAVQKHRQDVMAAVKESLPAVMRLEEYGEGGRFARVAWSAVRELAEAERSNQGFFRPVTGLGEAVNEVYKGLADKQAEAEVAKALSLFRHLAGREPTAEELAEARRAWPTLAPFKAPKTKAKK